MDALNATVKYSVVNTWGYVDPKTNAYTGMAGQLQRREAEIGGKSTFSLPEISNVISDYRKNKLFLEYCLANRNIMIFYFAREP